MRYALYLIGAPGVGKTSVMRELLKPYPGEPVEKPFAHTVYTGGIWLGAERGTFSGTDALSMSVQPVVLAFLANTKPKRVIAEGDRLANNKFFESMRRIGYPLRVVYLTATPETLARRRGERDSNQSAAWMKGRETKAHNLAQQWATTWLSTDTQTAAGLAAAIQRLYPDHTQLGAIEGKILPQK